MEAAIDENILESFRLILRGQGKAERQVLLYHRILRAYRALRNAETPEQRKKATIRLNTTLYATWESENDDAQSG